MNITFPTLELPPMGQLIALASSLVCLGIYCGLNFVKTHPSTSNFLFVELMKQSLFVYVVVQFIGFMYFTKFKSTCTMLLILMYEVRSSKNRTIALDCAILITETF